MDPTILALGGSMRGPNKKNDSGTKQKYLQKQAKRKIGEGEVK